MEELRKCPFCGGEAGITSESAVYSIMYFVMCRKCMGRSGYTPSPAEAIAAWNRRTQNIGEKECCERNEEQEVEG